MQDAQEMPDLSGVQAACNAPESHGEAQERAKRGQGWPSIAGRLK
jgi:hypothetical protein